MRDKLKDEGYWINQIFVSKDLRKQRYEKLANNLIVPERILIVKRSMSYSYVDSISAKYSAGYPIGELTEIIRDKLIISLKDAFITSKLSTVFSNIQSDKDNVIKKFFRESNSAPFSPIYYINYQYRKYKKNNNDEYGEYIKTNVTQQNIDNYITQQKNTYKK